MDRTRRPALVCLLWLLLALLPLRGLAQGHMALAGLDAPAAVAHAMPCHGGMDAAAEPATAPPASDGGASACPHCDLCHSALALSALPLLALPRLPQPAPQAGPDVAPAPARADTLFRPPRP